MPTLLWQSRILKIAFVCTFCFLHIVLSACSQSSSIKTDELDAVIERLQSSFIDQDLLNSDDLNRAAIQGVIDFVDDPYTTYMSQTRVEHFNSALEGMASDFEGIGASVTERGGEIVILGPLPGSPAQEAGIKPGDKLLAVDGDLVKGKTLDEVVTQVRGPQGTIVRLTISRVGTPIPFNIQILRQTISISSVLARMQSDDIGYIQLSRFDATTAENFRTAIQDLTNAGAKGLIIDLRNNGGGLVTAAVAVASEFISTGEILRWVESSGAETVMNVTGEGIAFDIPLVAIVNNFSASGSEVVVGALQDNGRAKIVGTRTFGKGSVNTLEVLDSGAGLYITMARWFTPKGRQIEGDGLEPDIVLGRPLNPKTLSEIGTHVTDLCAIHAEYSVKMEDYPNLEKSLNQLCNYQPDIEQQKLTDLFLDTAVIEMDRMLRS